MARAGASGAHGALDPGALVVLPGAGAGRDHPTLLACEAASPVPTTRYEFANPRARQPRLLDEVGVAARAAAVDAGIGVDRVVLGGRSFGGRMCSLAVAEGHPAAGLVLMAYPLHPPGRPENLRTAHLPQLSLPVLVVSGTRDPFGTPAELEEHLAVVPGPVTWCWVDGAGHDWRGRDAQVAGAVAAWLRGDEVPEHLVKPPRR